MRKFIYKFDYFIKSNILKLFRDEYHLYLELIKFGHSKEQACRIIYGYDLKSVKLFLPENVVLKLNRKKKLKKLKKIWI